MDKIIKRVAAIHDLSGFGKSSLTTIIPILSSMKIQVCPLPTAILSSQTDGFKDYSFLDLTDYMKDFINHWKSLNIKFDCIYTGFLGSEKQIELILDFVSFFKTNTNLIVVDPVLGDNFKLYDTVNKLMIEEMIKLIKISNIITPNITEAYYLLNKDIENVDLSDKSIKNICIELSKLGPNIVILTGVVLKDEIITYTYNKENKDFFKISSPYINVSYPGTGDTFTSVLIGNLLNNNSLYKSIKNSINFVYKGIKLTHDTNSSRREGILIEKILDKLI